MTIEGVGVHLNEFVGVWFQVPVKEIVYPLAHSDLGLVQY